MDRTCHPAQGESPWRALGGQEADDSSGSPGPSAFNLLFTLPVLLHALSQVTDMMSVPRSLLLAPQPLTLGEAQPLPQSLAALSLRAEASASGPAPSLPRKAARGPGASRMAAFCPGGHQMLPACHSWRQVGQSLVPWREQLQSQGRT